jgi:membrane protease YdiL (CAAX protease family)
VGIDYPDCDDSAGRASPFGQAPKPISVILIVLLNTIFIGISEETMFRGLMFSGLSKRFSYWPAVLLTIVLFGGIHLFNIITTGAVGQSILQTFLAMLSGALYLAIRLSMGSIIPAIIIHILWDWVAVLAPAAPTTPEQFSPWDLLGFVAVAKPVVFGILGFWVLWHIRQRLEADSTDNQVFAVHN